MKYLYIIALSLLLAQPALAARRVTGSVPTTTPLQPMPAGASANPQNNIQFQDQSHQGQFDANGNLIQNGGQVNGQSPDSPQASDNTAAPVQVKGQSNAWVWWLLFIAVALAGLWWWLRGKKA